MFLIISDEPILSFLTKSTINTLRSACGVVVRIVSERGQLTFQAPFISFDESLYISMPFFLLIRLYGFILLI